MRRYVKRHPLIAFFVLALAITWGLRVGNYSLSLIPHLDLIGWAPSIAGLVVAWAAGGTTGLRQLLDQALRWCAPLRWYLFVFVGFPGLVFCLYVFTAFVTDATFTPEFLGIGTIAATFVNILVLGVPGEELFGWRGFALPRMLDRWGDLTASVLLGVGWWLWHLDPSMWLNVSLSLLAIQVFYLFSILGVTILMTWVYRNSGSALLAGVGVHGALYFPQFYVTSMRNTPLPLLHFYLAVVIALIVIAVYGTKRFFRDPPEPPEENTPSPANSQ